MIDGTYRMAFGPCAGYSLARIVRFHPDYVEEQLADPIFCENNPRIRDYFKKAAESLFDPQAGDVVDPGNMPEKDNQEEQKEEKPKRGRKWMSL